MGEFALLCLNFHNLSYEKADDRNFNAKSIIIKDYNNQLRNSIT